MTIINQPFEAQLGNILIDFLNSSEYNSFAFIVAFAKNSGVLRLKESFNQFRKKGGIISGHIGIDLGGSSYEAVTNLLTCTDSLSIVHFENDQTFHPKVYFFEGKKKSTLIVGSNNLTGGGLWTNCESSVLLEQTKNNINSNSIIEEFKKYTDTINNLGKSCLNIDSQEKIEKMLEQGYLVREVEIALRQTRITTSVNKTTTPIFSKGIEVKIPKIKKEKLIDINSDNTPDETSIFVPPKTELQSFWIESRAMAGGSRNILDLSKKSLLEKGDPSDTPFETDDKKYIRGAVEFFELNPNDESIRKDITLNFDGVDYTGNTILYPEGDAANGTWRIQIKGISASGEEITEAFRKYKQYYLTHKILVFSKISSNYYSLSVFPETLLESFKKASFILARNGNSSSAKQLGYF